MSPVTEKPKAQDQAPSSSPRCTAVLYQPHWWSPTGAESASDLVNNIWSISDSADHCGPGRNSNPPPSLFTQQRHCHPAAEHPRQPAGEAERNQVKLVPFSFLQHGYHLVLSLTSSPFISACSPSCCLKSRAGPGPSPFATDVQNGDGTQSAADKSQPTSPSQLHCIACCTTLICFKVFVLLFK